MSNNLEDLNITELRAKAKELGLKANGGKQTLIDKITTKSLELLSEPVEEATATEGQDPIIIDDPRMRQESTLVTDSHDVEQFIADKNVNIQVLPSTKDGHKVDAVIDELNEFFAGRAQAKYNLNNPTMIEFHGGIRQRQDITIAQPKRSIMMYAHSYAGRAIQAGDLTSGGGLIDGKPKMNIASMSPAERAELKDQLEQLLAG